MHFTDSTKCQIQNLMFFLYDAWGVLQNVPTFSVSPRLVNLHAEGFSAMPNWEESIVTQLKLKLEFN
jgi:hypothetical protein